MAGKVRAVLKRFTTRRAGFAALAVAVTCMAGLAWRRSRLRNLELPDGRLWYTPNEAALLFDALDLLDANARLVYAATALTIDMVYSSTRAIDAQAASVGAQCSATNSSHSRRGSPKGTASASRCGTAPSTKRTNDAAAMPRPASQRRHR